MATKRPKPASGAVLDAARAYLTRGWSVVPIQARRKRPAIPWQRYQKSPPTPEQLDGWYARWPDANLGIVTGAVSGLVVVDVDPAHGGAESLAALEAEHGPLPPTVEARSGGGGRHLYFGHPGRSVPNRAGLEPGIDLRGDGGVIVAPPSVHPSGKRYRWRARRRPGQVELAPLPRWLWPSAAKRSGARRSR